MGKYINPPFNYSTSKHKLLDQLIPNFDYKKKTFIDLFTGSGSIYCNVLDKYDKVLVNDILTDLIGAHKQLTLSDNIINTIKTLVVDKDDTVGFLKLRDSYNSNPSPAKFWALMLCSNQIRFNEQNEQNQLHGHRAFNSNTEKNLNDYVAHIRPYKNKIIYRNKHYREIPLTMNAFYFIDSPYGYKTNKDGSIGKIQIMNSGDKKHYTQYDDIELYNYTHKLNDIGATFMVFGLIENDDKQSWVLNNLIKDGFSYKYIDMDYRKSKDKNYKEIIIYNYGL